MMTFFFKNGAVFTLRGSGMGAARNVAVCLSLFLSLSLLAYRSLSTLCILGTEPKLKYYTELPGKPGEADEVLADMIEHMIASFLKPQENKLEKPE
jgi:hypothetical protein